ncbi:hypothetical protein P9D31_12245 [Bacillus haynesii]|nr:hypothetical protein [Bacillus haynesii]MEC1473102.1 hypothetical protein [Bacillus haynesii]MEC1561128.1 hypothetical protein [Bacillus haynesii]
MRAENSSMLAVTAAHNSNITRGDLIRTVCGWCQLRRPFILRKS